MKKILLIIPLLSTISFASCSVGDPSPVAYNPVYETIDGIKPTISDDGKTVTYGLYPQNHVGDVNLINELNTLGDEDICPDNGWYHYKGDYYVSHKVNRYRSDLKFNDGSEIKTGDYYWFKCEPIVWDVLSNNDGVYYLLSHNLLDVGLYHSNTNIRTINDETIYSSNYKYSDIRAWLNSYDGTAYGSKNYSGKGFLDTAFSLDSKHLLVTEVDNSAATTLCEVNRYACENTLDKVFLPSYKDLINAEYGYTTEHYYDENRMCVTSEFCRASGSSCVYPESSRKCVGCGFYITRSPFDYGSEDYLQCDNMTTVTEDGGFCIDTTNYVNIHYGLDCIRPAITFKLA